MQKLKLAIVNVFFPPQEIGGATRVVADQVDVLKENYQDHFDLAVFTSEAEHSEPAHELTVYPYHGIPVYKASCIFREHMDWKPRDSEMGELFAKFLEYEQPDIIFFHCIQRLTGSIVEAAIEHNIPYWVILHDAWWISDYQFLVDENGGVYPEGHPDPYAEITLKSGVTLEESLERRFYLKDLLHKAKGVLAVSESFAEIYHKNGLLKTQANVNGISDKVNWQPKETGYTDKVVCAHIGGMAEHKGYFLFKQAIEKLKPKNIEVLVVDLSQSEGYLKKSNWQGVPVNFIGRVSKDNIVALYQKIDVLFAPSIWPESFGLVTREAAACGCWVVASNLGGIGEDVTEGKDGFVIEPTLEGIDATLKQIEANPSQFKKSVNNKKISSVKTQVNQLVGYISD